MIASVHIDDTLVEQARTAAKNESERSKVIFEIHNIA